MKYGEIVSVKFSLFKKEYFFECDDNGIVLENDGKTICIYGTDNTHQKIYCAIPLGPSKMLKKLNFYVFAHDAQYMMASVAGGLFVIDFKGKCAATNIPNLKVFGSDFWGRECHTEWKSEYFALFGLPDESQGFNEAAAESFWTWFKENEQTIIYSLQNTKNDSTAASRVIEETDKRLCPIFPYALGEEIEFQLGSNDGNNEFMFFHSNNKKLETDANKFFSMMPDELKANWHVIIEE